MSALLNFHSFLIVILLFICTSTYIRSLRPQFFAQKRPGLLGLVYFFPIFALDARGELLDICGLHALGPFLLRGSSPGVLFGICDRVDVSQA